MIVKLMGLLFMAQTAFAEPLVVPLKAIPTEFDPHKIQTIYEMVVDLQVHRGLMRFNPNLTIAPSLAESYEVFDGGKRVRFKLARRTFSDGTPVTSDHVVRTFQRLYVIRAGHAADLDYIENARMILNHKHPMSQIQRLGVKAVDPQTVEFTLERNVATFLAHLAIVDSAILPLNEKLEIKDSAGAGPYRIAHSSKDKIELSLTAAAQAAYPKAPKSIRLVAMDTLDALKAALNGEVHSLDGYTVPKDAIEQLKRAGWRESVSTITRQLYIVLNPVKVSKAVRQAVYAAVRSSPQPLIGGTYSKSYGLIPDSLQGALLEQDVTKVACAKPSGPTADLELTVVESEPYLLELAENLKKLLAVCGIEMTVKRIAMEKYMPALTTSSYQGIVQSKFLDYPDGMSVITYFRSNYSSNTFFIQDTKVDKMLDQAMSEMDNVKRLALYKKIQLQILSHRIVIPAVFGSDNRGLWHPVVDKVPAHPLGLQGFPMETLTVGKRTP